MNKLLNDFLPLLLFFIALFVGNRFYPNEGIYIATGVAILASCAQMIHLKWTHQTIQAQNWLNFIIILVFGGLTLILHDDTFIKWKPTILYWGFAIALLGGRLFKRNFIEDLLSKEITLPSFVWHRLNIAWSCFFIVLGLLNLWIAFTLTTEQWALFKVFGSLLLILVFSVLQGLYMAKYLKKE